MVLVAGCAVRPHDTSLPGAAASNSAAAPVKPADAPVGHVVVECPEWLKPLLEDASKEYATKVPGATVEVAKQASGGEGAGDLVVSAGGVDLAASGLPAEAKRQVIGHVALAVAVAKGNPMKLRSMEALAKSREAKLAVPDAAADGAGQAFTDGLKKTGGWDAIASRVVSAPSRASARKALEDGDVQAAVAYAPEVVFAGAASKIGLGFFLTAETVSPVELVVAERRGSAPASAFAEFLASGRGQALLAKHGLLPTQNAQKASGKSLLVPCGAALQPAMDLIGEEYEKRTGVRVDFSYAGAQMLLGQLAFSRRGDLYMPGEGFWVMQAVKRGYVKDYKPVVYFTPVIMVPKGNPKGIRTVQDMAKPGVRVALGHPEALAVGPLTKRIMQRAGIWESVRPNVVMEAGCIPELTNAVVVKGADAGIMWDASALQVKQWVDIVPIEPELNEVAEVLLATLKFSEDPEEADRFLDFVRSDDAKAIFERMEFSTKRPKGIRLAPLEGPGVTSK